MTAHMDAPTPHPVNSQPPTSAKGPGRPPGRERTSPIVLVLVFVGFVSLGLPDGLLGVAWPSVRQTFGLPIDALGALFLTTVCGYLAASLTSGWVVRRIGVGLLLALSGFATGACLLTFALAPTWAVVVSVGVLAGLGGGAIDAGLNSYVALSHSPRLLSWLHACFGLGAATGPAIMSAVLEAGHPWRLGYAIVGTGQLLLGLCFLLTRGQWQVRDAPTPQPPACHGSPVSPQPLQRGEGEIAPHVASGSPLQRGEGEPTLIPALSQRERETAGEGIRGWPMAVWLSILLFLVYTGIETAAGQWTYSLFVEERGISVQAASLGVSAYWGMLALGRVLAGLIANRVDPATLTRWSMAGMLAGATLIWLNAASWVSFGGLGLMGLSAASVFPSLIGATPGRFGEARAATVIGFQVAAAALGIAGLPALSGLLAARVGLEVIPLLLVVASVGMLTLHEAVVRLTSPALSRESRTEPVISTRP
jgi:fucose permease